MEETSLARCLCITVLLLLRHLRAMERRWAFTGVVDSVRREGSTRGLLLLCALSLDLRLSRTHRS